MAIVYCYGSTFYINMTNRCPCRCVFCVRDCKPRLGDADSLWLDREPTVEEVMDELRSKDLSGTREIVFCGYGEPTERLDDLLAVARHVKNIRPQMLVRINTNGLSDLIHGKPTAPMLKGLVDTVSISLNTPDPEEYLRICRPKFGIGSWQAMIDFAKSCRESVPDVVMTIVGEPVTTPEVQDRCRAISDAIGVRLRIRPYEMTGDGPPPPGR